MVNTWIHRGMRFILEQRITELKNSIAHWPDSARNPTRRLELSRLETELEEVNQKLLSS